MTSPISRLGLFFAALICCNYSFAQGASSSEASSAGTSSSTSANSSVSPAESTTPEKVKAEAKPNRDSELLAAALKAIAKDDEIEWIESDSDKTIALYKASETKVMKGTLWILHTPNSPSAWPPSLEILRRNLPLFGWASFALPLPHKNVASEKLTSNASSETSASSATSSTPSSTAASSASAASSSETSSIPNSATQTSSTSSTITREQIVNQRLDVGYAKLQEKGQLNVVVLIDNSSASLVLTNITGKSAPNSKIKGLAQALILVNVQTQEPLTKEQLKTIFSNTDLPVMDVFFDTDNSEQLEQRRNHRAEAQRQKLKDYQQLVLPPEEFVNLDNTQSFWLQKVRGFMDKKAESEEVKRAQKK